MRTVRIPTIQAMVAVGRTCEVCPLLASIGIETHCAGRIEGLHERRKSGAGGSRVNEANLVPACNWGNTAVEDNAGKVRDLLGDRLVVREGDPDWERFGRRGDRESTPET